VANDTGDLGLPAGPDLTVQTLNEVQATSPKLPPPAEVTNTVVPVFLASERRDRSGCVADEAADGMSVETEQERNKEVVRVPEGFERLLSDLVVSRCVHKQHAQKHGVASHTTSLQIVNVKSIARTKLSPFDVVEAIRFAVSIS
jgi:hypothetical protein